MKITSWWFFTNPSENYACQTGSWKPQFSGWNYSNKHWNHTTQIQTSSPGSSLLKQKRTWKFQLLRPQNQKKHPVACNLWYEILYFLRSQVDIKSHVFLFQEYLRLIWSCLSHVWALIVTSQIYEWDQCRQLLENDISPICWKKHLIQFLTYYTTQARHHEKNIS